MPVKELNATDPKFKGQLGSGKWTLCIGAGLSRGIVPTWQELTRRLVNQTFGTAFSEGDFQKLVSDRAWSLDSWIQACANHYRLDGKALPDFFDLIEQILYSDLRNRSKAVGLEEALVTVLDRPHTTSREDVSRVCEFFKNEYPTSSLLAIVRVLLRAIKQDKLPQAVVSFNADTLLETLVDLYKRQEHYLGPPPYGHPIYPFKTVLRPLDSEKGQVPFYHCHGAIKPKAAYSAAREPQDSRDRLIFLESEYIRVATEASSWAETLFMFYAQTTRMLFLGFSMSDPNMRRWLALSNQSALQDLNALTKVQEMTPRHIWLTVEPTNSPLKALQNQALDDRFHEIGIHGTGNMFADSSFAVG